MWQPLLLGATYLAIGQFVSARTDNPIVSMIGTVVVCALLLVSATGLEFAYSQAPSSMKGMIMSFWLLSVTFGNLWVLMTNAAVRNDAVIAQIASTGLSEAAFLMFFFAGFAIVVALIFGWYARHYPMQDHYRAV